MAALEEFKLFAGLTPADFQFLRGMAVEKSFARAEEIFHEGDPGDGLYLVREGAVEISSRLNEKDRRVFTLVKAGEIFGDMAVIEDKPRSACAVAVEPTRVYFVANRDFRRLVERCPVVATQTLKEISARLRDFNAQFLREVLQAERLAVVGRFARSIVHDLKNPLNIISISSELSGMAHATPESRAECRVRIARQVERISEMAGEILEFTQPARTGRVLAPVSFAQFARQTLAELESEVALKGVRLEVANPPPETLVALEPKRLRRVFQNLAHNATDALPEGGTIQVRFQVRERAGADSLCPAGTEVITEIEDSGGGIPPEIAGRLFEAFATYGKTHGTGLGLSICQRIIEDHNGWITAGNSPRGGAVFTFGLPVSG